MRASNDRKKTRKATERHGSGATFPIKAVPHKAWRTILRGARGERNQGEIIKQFNENRPRDVLELNQSVLSSWETGERRPPLESDRFRRLLDILGLRADNDMLRAEALRSHWNVSLVDVPDRLQEAQKKVELARAKGRGVDIWLIGPTSLPVLRSHGVREIWAKNIALGVNYRIIWFIDKDFDDLPLLRETLEQVGQLVPTDRTGHIYHYGINLLAPMVPAIEQWFADAAKGKEFFELTDDDDSVSPERQLNVIPPLIEIVTPDMALEDNTSNVAKLNEWPQIRGISPSRSREPLKKIDGIHPSVRLWLAVRRRWLDVWSLGSSASVYHFLPDSGTKAEWLGLFRHDDDEVLEQKEMSEATLEAYRKTIPQFRSCFMEFVKRTRSKGN